MFKWYRVEPLLSEFDLQIGLGHDFAADDLMSQAYEDLIARWPEGRGNGGRPLSSDDVVWSGVGGRDIV